MTTDNESAQAKDRRLVGAQVTPEEHRLLKAYAALKDISITDLLRREGIDAALAKARAAAEAATNA